MRTTTTATKNAWLGGDYIGANRPMVRATIQKLDLTVLSYGTTTTRTLRQTYTSVPFGQVSKPLELPNLKDVKWNRSVDGGVASMTMTLYNTEPLPVGVPPQDGDLDQPGFYSPLRGNTAHSSRWSRTTNGWQDWIVPDRIIRTYEGYGFDATVAPEVDAHLYLSGTWRIDEVTFTHDALITITCRDIGSVLLDQILFPPVVPFVSYPLHFETFHPVKNPAIVTSTGGSSNGWHQLTYETSSNAPYVGVGGAVYGHSGPDAFDTSDSTYWMSIGNARPDADYSFEYVQGKFASQTVTGGQFRAWGGPYTCYVSVYAGGKWQGDQTVPYNPNDPISAPNGANIRYLSSFHVANEATVSFKLPTAIKAATKMRLTFTNLYNSGLGTYHYRAGVRSFKIGGGTAVVTTTTPGGTHLEPFTTPPGISDYTDIVKILLAWAGFYWPREAANAFKTYSNGTKVTTVAPSNDKALVQGRVWGDFEQTGTYPKVKLDVNVWDKKPVMDGINYVRDIVGFIFYIDESGAAVFRAPNIWRVGNMIGNGGPNSGHTTTVVEIDERVTLMALSATMSGRSIREKVFVANVSGQVAAMADGHNPYPSGLRRVGGWCVDTETEIFTRRGWLRYDEVKPGDYTLSIDEATGQAVWQPLRDVAIFEDVERDMIEFNANNFSAVTTHDHRWLVERYSTTTKTWERRYVTSENLTSMDRIPRAARRGDVPLTPVVKDDLVELVAWTYTEGTVKTSRGGTQRITLSQSQTANPKHCERIHSLLAAMYGPATTSGRLSGAAWRERAPRRHGEVVWEVSSDASLPALIHLGPDKEPTMDFLASLTQEQLELFIDVSVMADGHERLTSEFSTVETLQFYQNVGPRLDAFLAACAMAGVPTSHHVRTTGGHYGTQPHAAVTLLQSDYYPPAQSQSGRERGQRDGVVWCPTMPTHHNWLARRNGSVYYTGNTDQNFATTAECQIMADLVTLRQLFTYRTNKITIPGNPAVQVDDQVRIFERVAEEVYLHYVTAISMNWSLETGKYTYDLDTHWLGDTVFSNWTFNPADLSKEAQAYLRSIGKIP